MTGPLFIFPALDTFYVQFMFLVSVYLVRKILKLVDSLQF